MKYKHAEALGYYYKIDELGNKSASFNEGKPKTSAAGMYREMKEWEDAGGVIEPQYTAEELVEKESEDSRLAGINKSNEIAAAKREAAIYLNELQIDNIADPVTKARKQFNDAVTEIDSRY